MRQWFRRWFRRSQPQSHARRPYRLTVEGLEERSLLSVTIDPITFSQHNLPSGRTLIVPVTATDTAGNTDTYTVQSTDTHVSAQVLTGDFLSITVSGFTGAGTMVFQLFNTLAPNTVAKIEGLVNQHQYDNLTFHRIVPNFVVQGGDPNGDGTGSLITPPFDDEFNLSAIFDGDGQLAMANSGKDTNGSQFFVTLGQQRILDFNHTIYGQLVRGFDVLRAMSQVQTDNNSRPLTPVVITSATLVPNHTDAVLLISSSAGFTGSANLSITANDGHGSTDIRNFNVTVAPDTTNDPPILGPVANQTTALNTPVTFTLTGTDPEGNPLDFEALTTDTPAHGMTLVSGNQVTFTPTAGFTGVVHLTVGVMQRGATNRGSTSNPFDTEAMTVTVTNTDAPLTGVNGSATAAVNSAFTGVIASFTDADPTSQPGDFTVKIDWGDGSPNTNGTVVQAPNHRFDVSGTHTYAHTGTFMAHVMVTDKFNVTGVTNSTTTATSTITVTLASNTTFVTKLYQDVLGRAPDAAGQEHWVEFLQRNIATRSQVALAIETSFEARTRQVKNLYQTLLGRAADNVGLDASIAYLGSGGNLKHLRAVIAGSPEYFSKHNRSNSDFLTALYHDALNRAVDPAAAAGVPPALATGISRVTFAEQIFGSLEASQGIVKNMYSTLLNRQADPSGLNEFAGDLNKGFPEEMIFMDLAGSDEYFNLG